MQDMFLDRIYSSFPLSIGTGIALESLFSNTIDRYDPKRVIPNKLNVDDYKYHYFSLYTLARNIISSSNHKNKLEVITNKGFLPTVLEEINIINSLYINTKCKPVIYFPDYEKISKYLNAGKDTQASKAFEEIIMIRNALKKIPSLSSLEVITDIKLPKVQEKALITTSMSVDLLNVHNVRQLALLESHTGKLKLPIDWNTKYHPIGTKPMAVFPFLENLLFVLGDKTTVNPMKLGIRLQLFQLAFDNNWTGKTTQDKVMFDLNKNIELKKIITSYKKLY